jgi:hypothetical protein
MGLQLAFPPGVVADGAIQERRLKLNITYNVIKSCYLALRVVSSTKAGENQHESEQNHNHRHNYNDLSTITVADVVGITVKPTEIYIAIVFQLFKISNK